MDAPSPAADLKRLTAEIREYVARQVAAGFDSADEIVNSAVEVYSDDQPPDVLRPIAQRLTTQLVNEHVAAQANWPAVTDCDRLDRAFAELEASGIVARQNFSCCGNCGVAEIADEIHSEQETGKRIRGYTFYHMQDTENAADGGGLYLNYGAVEDGEAAALNVANEIVEALNRHGLKTNWSGTWQQRIGVSLDWKRRR